MLGEGWRHEKQNVCLSPVQHKQGLLEKVNEVACDDFIRLGRQQGGMLAPFYHQKVTDEEVIEGLREEREALSLEHPYLALLPLKHT